MSSLTFLGAAGTVTGSKHLLEIDGHRILVDCGLFQGLKELRQRNWEPLPVGYERPIPLWPASNGRDAPTVEFINAGHLLGSAYARIRLGSRSVLFGGDLGRYTRPVLPDPLPVSEADYLLLESTYGDRLH